MVRIRDSLVNIHSLIDCQIVILASGCMTICVIPRFQTHQWRHFRTLMFVAVGLSGVLPMSHAVRLFGVGQAHRQMGWSWFVLEAVCYISGAAVYAVSLKRFLGLEQMAHAK